MDTTLDQKDDAMDLESPQLKGLMMRIPEDVRGSFSTAQRTALARAMAASRHSFQFQVSLPVPGRRYYLAVFAGRERRSAQRLRHEGQLARMRVAVAYGLALWLFFTVSGAGAMALLYLLRSAIDGGEVQAAMSVLPL
ncbi:MAG: hypothetical protein RLZ98_3293 [Pseudomonadota bacterium]|jgi:hypothetical protein